MIWTIPNLLTLGRLFLLIPICLLIALQTQAALAAALILYAVAAVSDYVDGWWARRFNAGSAFGRMLDPVADKIFVAALFIMLAAYGHIAGGWLACPILILAREFLISGLREFLGPQGITVPVSKLAKWKTTVQMVAIGALMIQQSPIHGTGLALLLLATTLTLITAAGYLRTLSKV